jgi:hypothetical protein
VEPQAAPLVVSSERPASTLAALAGILRLLFCADPRRSVSWQNIARRVTHRVGHTPPNGGIRNAKGRRVWTLGLAATAVAAWSPRSKRHRACATTAQMAKPVDSGWATQIEPLWQGSSQQKSPRAGGVEHGAEILRNPEGLANSGGLVNH